ncbi:MAG: DUF711 family protein [Gammaproteobacteria bacterium]
MEIRLSRRYFLGLLGTASLWPFSRLKANSAPMNFRIRTITAGMQLGNGTELEKIEANIKFLQQTRRKFEALGYEIQTLRMATQSLSEYIMDWKSPAALETIRAIDRLATEHEILFSIGPVIKDDQHDPGFAGWAAQLINQTSNISFSVSVASPEQGIHQRSARSAAEAIAAIARDTPGGEGNFRFAGTAWCPPGTPFFPAAYHAGTNAFSIGLESPNILQTAFTGTVSMREAKTRLKTQMETALDPIEKLATEIAQRTGLRYLGIDVSPAPGLDASIGRAIEMLIGEPFGNPSTLSACAAITDVLKGLSIRTCGYSGLMLPVLEDPVLARRAAEGRYSVSELLLFSSVCGTGLDVVPLPGDVPVDTLAALIRDVAALATKLRKPLSARLLPVSGKKAGESVHFDNPYLTDSSVMGPG